MAFAVRILREYEEGCVYSLLCCCRVDWSSNRVGCCWLASSCEAKDKDRVDNVSSLGHPAMVGLFDWAARSLDCTVAWPCDSAMVTLPLS